MPNTPDEVEVPEIYGTANNDIIFDTHWSGQYYGLAGDDVFYAHANDASFNGYSWQYHDDYFYGGSGSDAMSYVLSEKKIIANLGTGIAHRIFDGQVQSTDYLSSIENLTGSSFHDSIYGSGGANLLRGGGGNDTVLGLGGYDHVWGDSGNDSLDGGYGIDSMDGGTGNDVMEGGAGNDAMNGGDGADTVEGGTQNDVLKGGAHNDKLFGQAGDDHIEGGSGNDTLDGGAGIDTAVYTGSGAVMVNLWGGTATGAWGSDTLIGIERVETGTGDDIVFGSFESNRLHVGGGNDTVYALDGHDIVYASSGADAVYGYEGNDLVYGGANSDTIWGGSDGDVLLGEDGADRINGEDGNDSLSGDAGADRMRGGDGLDTINGGSGADAVAWEAGDSGADLVAGFNLAEDRLWFGPGFFAAEPVGNVDLIDVLTVFDSGANAVLAANTAEDGWTVIATLLNVDAYDLGQMIENESILAPGVVNLGGGPGDLF